MPSIYYLIFLTLVALTLVTLAIALVRFKSELVNVLIALIIASDQSDFCPPVISCT